MLYHKDVFFRKRFEQEALELLNDNYSMHLLTDLLFPKRRNHTINTHTLSCIIDDIKNGKRKKYSIYEVETDGTYANKVIKAVLRTAYDKYTDVSIVFTKDCVVTAWLNDRQDTHNTLDTERYYKYGRA